MHTPSHPHHHRPAGRRRWLLAIAAVLVLLLAACGSNGTDASDDADGATAETTAVSTSESSEGDDTTAAGTDADEEPATGSESPAADASSAEPTTPIVETAWAGDYQLADEEFGTMVTVTVADGTRTIVTNALPDHETGDFPNGGNPNEITEQSLVWEFPTEPTFTGQAVTVRTTGVAVNGIKFEPATGESVSCASGETYRIEALQDTYDLGLDFNNAHVQPTGEYHYHGISEILADDYSTGEDLVHIGFAADGHLMYYSWSGAYESGWQLVDGDRSGTDCVVSGPAGTTLDLEGTAPDGTYSSDWSFDASNGDLDECNGTTIDGEYVYIVTQTYPFVSRCLMGDVTGVDGVDGVGGGGAGAAPGGAPGDGEGQASGAPDRPDFAAIAVELGVSQADLEAALGQPPLDLQAAAEALGISVADLEAALPPPPGR